MDIHTYYREDTQEIKYLPINEENCYYLGKLKTIEIIRIKKYLKVTTTSFRDLVRNIDNGMFK